MAMSRCSNSTTSASPWDRERHLEGLKNQLMFIRRELAQAIK
jgi:hypothetical protein